MGAPATVSFAPVMGVTAIHRKDTPLLRAFRSASIHLREPIPYQSPCRGMNVYGDNAEGRFLPRLKSGGSSAYDPKDYMEQDYSLS